MHTLVVGDGTVLNYDAPGIFHGRENGDYLFINASAGKILAACYRMSDWYCRQAMAARRLIC